MIRALLRNRAPFLAGIVLLTVVLAAMAARVVVERSNESMNARDDSVLAAYQMLRTEFGNDENLLIVLSGEDVLSRRGLMVTKQLRERIVALDGVSAVAAVTHFEQIVHLRAGASVVPLVASPFDRREAPAELSAALDRNPQLTGLLVSEDRRSSALLVELQYRRDDDLYRGRVIDEARRLVAEVSARDGYAGRVTGLAVQKHDVFRYVTRDQRVLIPTAVAVIAAVLWLFFRTLAGMALPLCVTAISLIWTIGCYSAFGLALNTITSLLPPVVMVLSIATSVHVYAAWSEHIRGGTGRVEAIEATLAQIGFPCTFTALTTVVGFASLVVSNTPAVRLFGTFAAIGVLFSFALGLTLVPVLLSYQRPASRPASSRSGAGVDTALALFTRSAVARPGLIVLLGALLVLPALALLPKVRNNTDLIRFLRPHAPLRQDTTWIARHFGPVLAVDAIVTRRDGRALATLEDLARLESLQEDVARLEGVESVAGPVDLIEQLERGESGAAAPALPEDQAELEYLFDLIDAQPSELTAWFYTPDRTAARIRAGLADVGTRQGAAIIAAIERAAAQRLGDAYRLQPTGAFHQVVVGSQGIVRSQVTSFVLALVLIVVAIAIEFRSPVIVLVAAVPNVLPILLVVGLMGGLGIDLSTGTAMIASVVIGLAVDDTIHYLARFRSEYEGDAAAAVERATRGVGRVLVMTSVALVLGFWVGGLGSFMPTVHFSLLSGTTMLLALVYDLLVLPACLQLVAPRLASWSAAGSRGRRA